MIVREAASAPGGSAHDPKGERVLAVPVTTAAGRLFREVLYLRLATGGLAETIVVDADNTVLTGRFTALDYDALAPPEPSLAARLTARSGAIVVELDAPRRVTEVRLARAARLLSGHALEFYRLDGDALAAKPTVTVPREELRLDVIAHTRGGGPGIARSGAPGASVGGTVAVQPDKLIPRFPVDFTDLRFALQLVDRDGHPVTLGAGDVAALGLRTYPTGVRLRLGPAEDPGAAVTFWQASGEIGNATPAGQGEFDVGPAVADAAARHLARIAEPAPGEPARAGALLPAAIDLALVVESEAPCRRRLTDLALAYRLARRSFASGADKAVLRFDGAPTRERRLELPVPAGAAITAARLITIASFGPDRATTSAEAGARPAALPARGILLGGAGWVGQRVDRVQAATVTGVAVGLLALTAGTEVRVELQTDADGVPTGRMVAGGVAAPVRVGRAAWCRVTFAQPGVVTTDPHWLLVTATRGRVVWLAEEVPGSVRLLTRESSRATWSERLGLPGLRAVHDWLAADREARAKPAFTVALGEQVIAGTERDGERVFELAAGLNAWLAAHRPAADLARVPLSFAAETSGILSAYPPLIEYDLP